MLQYYTTIHCSALHYTNYTIPSTLHYATTTTTTTTTRHYTTLIRLHYNYSYNYATLITLHYSYNYNCATARAKIAIPLCPRYIQQLWVTWPLQPLQRRSSNYLSVHQWIRSAIMHHNVPLLSLPMFETIATALCGTTGIECSIT